MKYLNFTIVNLHIPNLFKTQFDLLSFYCFRTFLIK